MRWKHIIFAATTNALIAGVSMAQDAVPESTEVSILDSILCSGIPGLLIVILSIAAMTLCIKNYRMLKGEALMPSNLITEVRGFLEGNKVQEAHDVCAANGSYFSLVMASGLAQLGSGSRTIGAMNMKTSMEEASQTYIGKYYRSVEWLSLAGNIAPMLGLLGTVIGMIKSFNAISHVQGMAKSAALATGISEALMTTCMGLVVAIPTLFAYSWFHNTIESQVAKASAVFEEFLNLCKQES